MLSKSDNECKNQIMLKKGNIVHHKMDEEKVNTLLESLHSCNKGEIKEVKPFRRKNNFVYIYILY